MTDTQNRPEAASSGTSPANSSSYYWAEVDKVKCSMCEMCARKCPTGAFTLNQAGEIEQLLYSARLCDACGGEVLCQTHCPEEAVQIIERTDGTPMPEDEKVMMEGEMVACLECKKYFVPALKLETLIKQAKVEEKDVQRYCPDCRRTRLLENHPLLKGETAK